MSTLGGDAADTQTTGSKMLELLLGRGADPNAACGLPGGYRPSVLVTALDAGSAWAVRRLIEGGADPDEAREHVCRHGVRMHRGNPRQVLEALRLIV